jgi:molybdate transport system substrate-binding protein
METRLRKSCLSALTLLVLLAAGCRPAPESATLHVFAAASLTEAFDEIGRAFEASHPGVTVVYNFAGSQQLAQQILEGAPADVFASASSQQMDALIHAGRVAAGSAQPFARNRLVVVFPAGAPAALQRLQDLARPGLKLALAAREVPVGQYSLDFLDKAASQPGFGPGYRDAVLRNVVSYEENVKAVVAKVSLGEADAGIVYLSDLSGENAAGLARLEIPQELNVTASYPIAAVREGGQAELARSFIDFVLGAEGQAVLVRHNFLPAP